MQPLAVDPRVLRAVLGTEIKVMPGRALMARVVAADGRGRGSLSIAGFLVEAELPKDVRAGSDLRLIVREVTRERVLLSLSEGHTPSAAQPVPPAPMTTIPLPGGATLQVTERDARGESPASPESHTLAVRFRAPALGDVDLRLALDPATLTLAVTVDPGMAMELARADADTLRRGLTDALNRAVSVTVAPRRRPLDVYA